MNETDDQFFDMMDDMISVEANKHLDKHLDRVDQWRAQRLSDGEPVTLRALIEQVMGEKNKRGPVLAAYATAIWRLMEKEHRL